MKNFSIVITIRKSRLFGQKAPVPIKVILERMVVKTMDTGIKISPANQAPF